MKHKTSEMMSMLDQNHVMKYMDELSADEQKEFIDQIDSLDLSVLSADATEEKRGEFFLLGNKRGQRKITILEAKMAFLSQIML